MALPLSSSALVKAGAKSAGKSALRLAAINAGAGGLSLHGYQKAYLQIAGGEIGSGPTAIIREGSRLYCQFNPASITISKGVSWESSGGEGAGKTDDAYFQKDGEKMVYHPVSPGTQANRNVPYLEFKGGAAATFSLELLFDTTDQPPDTPARDVRRYTNDLLALTLGKPSLEESAAAGEVEAPKPVRFGWGGFELFEAVITSVEIGYIMFDPDGKPVRATANVGFLEWSPPPPKGQNPTTRTEPRKTWIVQQGQTLHQIAYAEYGHPSHWRHLADSNNLLNPLKLKPGQVLILPPRP